MRDDTHIQYFLHFYNQIALKLQIASSLKDEKDFMSNKKVCCKSKVLIHNMMYMLYL